MSIRACLMCLATGDSLNIRIEPLLSCYQALTGCTEAIGPGYVCWECAAHLKRFRQVRLKSLRAFEILKSLTVNQDEITQEIIEDIDREKYDFESSLQICQLKNWEINGCIEIYVNIPKSETNGADQNDKKYWLCDNLDIVKKERECVDSFEGDFFSCPDVDTDHEKSSQLSSKSFNGSTELSDRIAKDFRGPRSSEDTQKDEPHSKSPIKRGKKRIKRTKKSPRGKSERAEFFSKFVDVVPMTQEEAADMILRRRETANYKTSRHVCHLCYKGFWQETAYKNHMNTHDPSNGAYECDLCRVRFVSRGALVKHIRARHRFKFCCRKCPNVCNEGSLAMKHEAWHNGTSYSCKHCDAKFDFYSTMANHVRKKHAQEFLCRLCGLCFVGRRGVRVHTVKAHGGSQMADGEGEHPCDECDVKFATLEALKRHRVVSAKHNLKETANGCEACGEIFPTRDAYMLHHRLSHSRYTNMQWNATRSDIAVKEKEKRARAKRKTSDEPGPAGEQSKVNPMCEICGKVFRSVYTLRDHLRKHRGERPFRCALCPKAFAVKHLRELHARTHTKERPHRCDACGRAFSTSSNLCRHVKMVHTVAKPVPCDICNKLFKNKSCMTDHIKFVHLKKPYPVRRGRLRKGQNAAEIAKNAQLNVAE